ESREEEEKEEVTLFGLDADAYLDLIIGACYIAKGFLHKDFSYENDLITKFLL
ncbi:hypothetical protein SK128_024826, partial [Halocaridina rubra]